VSTTQRQKPAIYAWTGATLATIRPDAANDGVAILGYKVTNPSPGVWHYEYAVYNQNLDRAIQSFSVALPSGAVLTNVGFRNPMQHPSSAADGTAGNTGFSNTPWRQAQAASPNADSITWNSDTFASNPNANAIRWGTMYNFHYDSNLPPQAATVTIGFFKSGSPVNIQVFAPTAASTSVSGRVMNSAGQGLSNAVVLLTDSNGNSQRTVRTSSLGYYSIDDIETGGTYTIEVRSKRHTFPPRVLQINDKLTDIDFTAEP
ncbi:MAG TPA: carboxypeptidase-like regulatory domain-containing protein, partial [Pyrinomonadaceae bacterium]|nr:carboxypeptidase-like regulatory domain-containing protein [Pyrinomonadaceae bacterium]